MMSLTDLFAAGDDLEDGPMEDETAQDGFPPLHAALVVAPSPLRPRRCALARACPLTALCA